MNLTAMCHNTVRQKLWPLSLGVSSERSSRPSTSRSDCFNPTMILHSSLQVRLTLCLSSYKPPYQGDSDHTTKLHSTCTPALSLSWWFYLLDSTHPSIFCAICHFSELPMFKFAVSRCPISPHEKQVSQGTGDPHENWYCKAGRLDSWLAVIGMSLSMYPAKQLLRSVRSYYYVRYISTLLLRFLLQQFYIRSFCTIAKEKHFLFLQFFLWVLWAFTSWAVDNFAISLLNATELQSLKGLQHPFWSVDLSSFTYRDLPPHIFGSLSSHVILSFVSHNWLLSAIALRVCPFILRWNELS